jgi:hypothetical protein
MMRRRLFGLVLIPLMVGGIVTAKAQVPSPVATGPQQTQTDAPPLSPTGASRPRHDAKNSKKAAAGSKLPPLAAAHASEPSDGTPISAPQQRSVPSARPWTGFYVGAGAGVGASQQ